MKLAKNTGCACGSGLLYKDICWLHSLGRPGREEPGSETCKEIETTRRLLKEHSTHTLTASLCEHEAIKTWSGKLPSLYFTQQENLGCPGWQNNLRPPKSSHRLSPVVQSYYSAGTQNIQHGLDWIFHCYCEVLSDKTKILYFDGAILNMLSAYVRGAVFTSPRRWQIGVCLSWQSHACRQVCPHASLLDVVSALYMAGGDRDLLQVAHVVQRGSPRRHTMVPYCRCLPRYGSRTGPQSHNTAHRAYHLTGPNHCTQTTPTSFCHAPFRFDVESVLQLPPMWLCSSTPSCRYVSSKFTSK